jgi:Ca2+-binding EF-hand superfamily protein
MELNSKKGLIDTQLKGQLHNVFGLFDSDKRDALSWDQFEEYLYAIGMNFINKEYQDKVLAGLFKGEKS